MASEAQPLAASDVGQAAVDQAKNASGANFSVNGDGASGKSEGTTESLVEDGSSSVAERKAEAVGKEADSVHAQQQPNGNPPVDAQTASDEANAGDVSAYLQPKSSTHAASAEVAGTSQEKEESQSRAEGTPESIANNAGATNADASDITGSDSVNHVLNPAGSTALDGATITSTYDATQTAASATSTATTTLPAAGSGPPTPTLANATIGSAPKKFASVSVTKKFLEKAAPSPAPSSSSGTLTLSLGSGSKLGTSSARSKLAPTTKTSTAGWAPVPAPTTASPSLASSTANSKLLGSLSGGRSGSPNGLRSAASPGGSVFGSNVRSSSPAGSSGAGKSAPWAKSGQSTPLSGVEGLNTHEASRLKTVFPTAAEAARAQKEAEERAAAAAAEAQARQEEALKALESFRGRNLGSGNHWDDLDDDDMLEDVVDFGDGHQYKVSAQPAPAPRVSEAEQAADAERRTNEELDANFSKEPVSKEDRFRDVGHDRSLASRAAPPPWGGIKRTGSGLDSREKQLFDAKAPAPRPPPKDRRLSGVGASSIQLLQRDRAPSQSESAHSSEAATAPQTVRSWGPLAQRQASLNKVQQPGTAPTTVVSTPPASKAPAPKPAAAATAEPPKAAITTKAPSSTSAAKPISPVPTAAAVAPSVPSGPPRPPPWGGVKRSFEGQSAPPAPPAQAATSPMPPAAAATAPKAEAAAANEEASKEEVISAVERARKRREEEERRRLEEKERARAKAAALEAKLKEQEEKKRREAEAKREAELAKKAEAQAARERANMDAEKAKQAGQEESRAKSASDLASSWRRPAPVSPERPEHKKAAEKAPEKPQFTVLQRPAQPAPVKAEELAPTRPKQQPRAERVTFAPIPPSHSGKSTESKATPPNKQIANKTIATPKREVKFVPKEPLLTRPEVPFDGPPVWRQYPVRLIKGLARHLLDAKAAQALRGKLGRTLALRSHPIYALTWDPPLFALSLRTLSRDDMFFPKSYVRGVVHSRVSIAKKRLPRGLKPINKWAPSANPTFENLPELPDDAVDQAIATAPMDSTESSKSRQVKVSLPKPGRRSFTNKIVPSIRLPRSNQVSSIQKALGPGDTRRAPGSQVYPLATTRSDVQELIMEEASMPTAVENIPSVANSTVPMSASGNAYGINEVDANAAFTGAESALISRPTSALPIPPTTAATTSPWGFPILQSAPSAPDSEAIKKVWSQPSGDKKAEAQNSLKGINDDYLASTLPLSVHDLRNEEAPPMPTISDDSRRASEESAGLVDFAGADSALFDPHVAEPLPAASPKVMDVTGASAGKANGFGAASVPSPSNVSVTPDFSGLGGSKGSRSSASNGFGSPSVTMLDANSFGPADYSEAYPTYGYYQYGVMPQQMNALAAQQRAYSGYSMPMNGASPYGAMSAMGMNAYAAFRPPTGSIGKGYYGNAAMGSSTGAMAGWPIDSQSPQMQMQGLSSAYGSIGRSNNYRGASRGGRDSSSGFGSGSGKNSQAYHGGGGKGYQGGAQQNQQQQQVSNFGGGAAYGSYNDSVW